MDDLESRLVEGRVTKSIIGGYYEVYNELRFGFLESVYVAAMERELIARGHEVRREVAVRVSYKGEDIAWHRLDLLVDGRVVVESKAGERMAPTAQLQLHNYLRATGLEVGLLFHLAQNRDSIAYSLVVDPLIRLIRMIRLIRKRGY